MSTPPDQPAPRFTEQDLLGYVEDALPAARAELVRRAIEGDAALRRRVAAMRRDRALLADLVEDRAPEGLVEQALGQIELGALLAAEPALRHPAAGGLEPTPADPLGLARRRMHRRRRVPITALTGVAAVALLALGAWTMWPARRSAPQSPLASAPIEEQAPRAMALESAEPAPEPAEVLARAADARSLLDAEIEAMEAPATSGEGAPVVVVVGDAARAAELARAGRLAIGVPTDAAGRDRLLARLDRATPAGRLVLEDGADAGLIAQVVPERPFAWGPDAFASATPPPERSPARGPRPPRPTPIEPAVLALDVLAEAGALERARAALGPGAVFVELPAPAGWAAPESPEGVLWWTLPPDRWAPPVRVPVVIYAAE